jgi:hypothetical protein
MTSPVSRIATVVVAATLGASLLGCGVFAKVKHAAGNVATVTDLAGKLRDAQSMTYTAQYRLADGSTATVAQQPPNSSFAGRKGRMIVTADAYYLCQAHKGVQTCQKSVNTGAGLDTNVANMIPGVAGDGFVSAPVALAAMTAASLIPDVKLDSSERTIAGQHTTCLKVNGLTPSPATDGKPKDFTLCVTDKGLLGSFDGSLTDGKPAHVELTSYRDGADAAAFRPPAGAKIVKVDQIQPTR